MAKDYSEDQLIQKSTADFMEKELGWKSIFAFDQEKLGVDVEGIVCGDGCFKSSDGIWELADPEPSPYYTPGLTGTPNEVKLKDLLDSSNTTEDDVKTVIKNSMENDLKGEMISQGTTPRKIPDIVASIGDLIMTSGHAGTPVFVIKNFKKTYAD